MCDLLQPAESGDNVLCIELTKSCSLFENQKTGVIDIMKLECLAPVLYKVVLRRGGGVLGRGWRQSCQVFCVALQAPQFVVSTGNNT